MNSLFILIVVVFIGLGIVLTIIEILKGDGMVEGKAKKPAYLYTKKNYFLTPAEHEFYDVLGQAVGAEYRIFAQVHFSSILDEHVKGQSYKAARAHIDRKSIDFLLCDKDNISPILAIELDDKTHNQEERQARDEIEEGLFKQVGLPLLRIKNHGRFDVDDIRERVYSVIKVT